MLCIQESTIKSNFTYMRLLCGLLLFSIIDCCFYSWNLEFHFLVGVTQFSALTLALQLLFHFLRNYYFLPLFKVIPPKLTHFQLIFQTFFSFKTWFINKFQVIEFKPDNFRIHSLASGPFQGWDGSLESRSLSKSLWQHNRATNLAF